MTRYSISQRSVSNDSIERDARADPTTCNAGFLCFIVQGMWMDRDVEAREVRRELWWMCCLFSGLERGGVHLHHTSSKREREIMTTQSAKAGNSLSVVSS